MKMFSNKENDIDRKGLYSTLTTRVGGLHRFNEEKRGYKKRNRHHGEKQFHKSGRYDGTFIPTKAQRFALMYPISILSFILFFICTAFIDMMWTIHFKWGLWPQLTTTGPLCSRLVHNNNNNNNNNNDRAYPHPLVDAMEMNRAEAREKIDARSFVQKYMKGRKPLVIHGALDSVTLAYNQQILSDENLRRVYDIAAAEKNKTYTVTVETDKYDSRSPDKKEKWPMQKFIERYRSEDIYAVIHHKEMLPDFLYKIKFLPLYNDILMQAVVEPTFHMWISSGGTNSSIHVDAMNNLEMIVYGKKTFYVADVSFIDSLYLKEYPSSYQEEMSPVSFEKPNFQKHPKSANIKWKRIDVGPGDEKVETQSLAVNVFFNDDVGLDFVSLQRECLMYKKDAAEKTFGYFYIIFFFKQLKAMLMDLYLLQPSYSRFKLRPNSTTWAVGHTAHLYCRNLPFTWDEQSSHVHQLSNTAIGDGYATIDQRIFTLWLERKKRSKISQCPNMNGESHYDGATLQDMCSRCTSGDGSIKSDELFFHIMLVILTVSVVVAIHTKREFPLWVKGVSRPWISFILTGLLILLVIVYSRTVLLYFTSA